MAPTKVTGVDNFDPFYDPAEKRRNLAGVLEHPAFELVEADCADLTGPEAALGSREADGSCTSPRRRVSVRRSRTRCRMRERT